MKSTQYDRYVSKDGAVYLTKPNDFVIKLAEYLPNEITTIILLGSCNGRDFLPFINRNLRFIGIDIMDRSRIDWVPPLESNSVEYIELEGEGGYLEGDKFINFIEKENNSMLNYLDKYAIENDTNKTIVISAGTIIMNKDCQEILNTLISKYPNFVILEGFFPGDYITPWSFYNRTYEHLLGQFPNKKIYFVNHPVTTTATLVCKMNLNLNIINNYLDSITLPHS